LAKFRTSYSRKRRSVFSGGIKLVIVFLLLGFLFFLFNPTIRELLLPETTLVSDTEQYFLPAMQPGDELYFKKHYTLSYAENYEQSRWVAYELSVHHLNASKVKRADYFEEDISIQSGSASFYDYKNSGYTKGHLVPAADRAYSSEAMEETFLMSNMSPQEYHFNGGIWRELEEQTRDWARKFRSLYIVSGPMIPKHRFQKIGKNQVAVPEAFFKIILDANDPEMKGIAFIIPNAISDEPLQNYAMSIDEVEEKTGLDFFHELFTDKLESELEQEVDLGLWPINSKRYMTRINQWNKR
jgi:endonuclease G